MGLYFKEKNEEVAAPCSALDEKARMVRSQERGRMAMKLQFRSHQVKKMASSRHG
jgi:hypothetical protein